MAEPSTTAQVEDSGAPAEAAPHDGGDHEPSLTGDGDDFDPMAILQAGDSQLPKDDMDIDIDESAHGTEAHS